MFLPPLLLSYNRHENSAVCSWTLHLDMEGNPLPEQMEALFEIRHITQKKIEELLFSHIIKPDTPPAKKEEAPLVESMLSGCKVINYLVDKAKETHYLN